MKRIKRIKNNILLHPIMSFVGLIIVVMVLSGIFNLFNVSATYTKVAASGSLETVLVSVESLLTLSGIKYIFSSAVSNFASFAPLSMLLILLIGIGIMDKSGFLDSFFYVITKKVSKRTITYSLSLLCIIASIMGNISYIILIPLAGLLFKYGKRNPRAGIICAFASLSCGIGINITMSSVESALLPYTMSATKLLSSDYVINSTGVIFIMLIAALILAAIITNITEKITIPEIGPYQFEDDEEDYLTKREQKGLIISLFSGFIYILIFVYNIIPRIPFGGNLLDYSHELYIDKLFGYNSFFNQGFVFVVTFLFIILGLSYGIVNKSIKNHRDVCTQLSHSLDGVGRVIVLIFMSSLFILVFKKTNIGPVILATISTFIGGTSFSGIPLILTTLLLVALGTVFVPDAASKWVILSGTLIPVFMNAGMSPEFTTVVFRAGESIMYALTPVMAYFIIYIAFMELYSQDNEGSLRKYVKHIFPYAKYTALMWALILVIFYITGFPLGITAYPSI